MAYIGVQPADAYTSFAVQHFTTSATTSYTLNHSVANENEIALFINNVRQEPGSSYAYTASGTSLTLSAATSASDTMYCVFIGKAVQTVTPTLPIANFSSTGIDDNADATAITIDSSENVGIGTTSPSTTLDVNGTITANRIIADSTTLVVDATNNRVGIGTASPDRELTVGSVANARIGILSSDNSTGASQLQFGDTDNSQVGRIYYEHSDDTMRFHTGNVERARISSSGFHIGGTGSANALDDYEEGTWTPTLATNGTNFSSVGYANRIGSYTKIGRLVLAPFYVQLNSLTVGSPSGNVVITGLPFTSLSNSANKASIIAYITNLNYGLAGFSASNDSINYGANVIHNTTTYQLTRSRNSNTADGIPYQALTSSSFAIVGTAIYDTN